MLAKLLALGWTAVIAVVCLVPSESRSAQSIELCLVCGDYGVANLLLNVILYLPLGMALGIRLRSVGRAMLLGLLLSVGIELLQLGIPGRFTTLGDVVSNAAAAGLGAFVVTHLSHPAAMPGRLRHMLSFGWALGAAGIVVATGFLFAPSVPSGDLYGNWTSRSDMTPGYEGTLLSASIADVPIPSRRLADPSEVRALIEARAPLALSFELAPPNDRRSVLFRLNGPSRREAMRMDIEGADVLVGPPYAGADLRLARPWLRFASVLDPFVAGDTVSLELMPLVSGGDALSVVGGRRIVKGFTPGRGWILLRPVDRRPPRALAVLDLLWLTALLAPIGWWAPSLASLGLAGSAPLLALGLIPLWTPLLATPPLHYIAGIGLLLASFALSRAVQPTDR